MNLRIKLFFITIACLIASGCGAPGVPLPPSLEVPRPVTDLRVARKGDAVTLTWTLPSLTTEGRTITQSGSFEVCRSLAPMQHCDIAVASIPFRRTPRASSASRAEIYVDVLLSPPVPGDPAATFHYAVNALNSFGRTAGFSNQVTIPAVPTLPPPTGFQAQVTAEGIRLSWQAAANLPQAPGMRFLYRVYRREEGAKSDVVAGELPVGDASPSLLDHSFEWEKTYDYWITIVSSITSSNGTEEQVEGDDSPPAQVVAHDVFPPATPAGLQAVFSGPGQKPFIDLVWNANTEADLAGYNIYRREAGAGPQKINQDLVKSPSYRDANIVAGHEYTYSVSAVDVRGNESPRSEEAGEAVPAQ